MFTLTIAKPFGDCIIKVDRSSTANTTITRCKCESQNFNAEAYIKDGILAFKGIECIILNGKKTKLSGLKITAEEATAITNAIAESEAEENAEYNLRQNSINAIEGLKEIEAAIDEHDKYHRDFNRRMENENLSSIGIATPKSDIEALKTLYPRATAYLKALSFSNGANYARRSAGDKAVKRIVNGEDYTTVIADMESEWSASCAEHVWD